MEYNFITKTGADVKLVTEVSESKCFEMRLTCASVQVENQKVWMFGDDNMLRFPSLALGKKCAVCVPNNIANEIRCTYHNACRNTDKIIIATIKDKDGRVIRELYGKPVIFPSFALEYYMPEEMDTRVRSYAYNDKIYDMGGIEDDCHECSGNSLSCLENRVSHYWMRHAEMKDPFTDLADFLDQKEDEDYTLVDYDLELKVVTPFSNE